MGKSIAELRRAYRLMREGPVDVPAPEPDEEDLTLPEDDKWHLRTGTEFSHKYTPAQKSEREFASLYNHPKGFTEPEKSFFKSWSEGTASPDKLSPQDKDQLKDIIDFVSRGKISKESLAMEKADPRVMAGGWKESARNFIPEVGKRVKGEAIDTLNMLKGSDYAIGESIGVKPSEMVEGAFKGFRSVGSGVAQALSGDFGKVDEAMRKAYTGEDKFGGEEALKARLNQMGLPIPISAENLGILTETLGPVIVEKALAKGVKTGAELLKALDITGDEARVLNVAGAKGQRFSNLNPILDKYWPVLDKGGDFAYVQREVPWATVQRGMREGKYKSAIGGGAPTPKMPKPDQIAFIDAKVSAAKEAGGLEELAAKYDGNDAVNKYARKKIEEAGGPKAGKEEAAFEEVLPPELTPDVAAMEEVLPRPEPRPLPEPRYSPEEVKAAATRRANEAEPMWEFGVEHKGPGELSPGVGREGIPGQMRLNRPATVEDINEGILRARGSKGGNLQPSFTPSGPLTEADLLGREPIPSLRQAKAAERELAMKMNPNTVQDLQRAALISGDKDPLAVRLGIQPKGYQNDTLKKAEAIIDKPLSLFDAAKEAPKVEKAMTTVMREAWGKVMEGGAKRVIAHPFRTLDDVFGAVGLKPAYDKVVGGIGKIIPPSVKRGFLGSAGMEPANFVAYKKMHEGESIVVRDLTTLVSEKLGKDVTEAETHLLEGLMRGTVDPKHIIPSERNIELLKRYADTRETLDALGEAAVQMNLLKNEAFIQNIGKYLPQYYKGTELESLWSKVTGALKQPIKTIGSRFRPRKINWEELNLTTEGRMKLREMGAVENPAFSAGKGTLDIGQDLANSRFSRRIANDESMALNAPKTGGREGDWVQMPGHKAYGDLAGKWVHPDVARQVKDLHAWTTKNQALKLYDQMNGLWKMGKTAYNPSTWARNAYTNAWFFEGATGRSWLDPREWPFFKEGIGEYAKGDGELFRQLERKGLFGRGSADQEVRDDLRKMLAEATGTEEQSMLGKIISSPGKGYRAMDDVNRYLLAKHAHSEGMAIDDVVAFAKKHGIDYSAVGPVIQMASRVVPFIKYPFKAMPLVAEYLARRPATMAKYPAILAAGAYYAKKRAGWTEEDEKKAKGLMKGTWMENRRLWMVPWKDDKGRTQYLDTSFFVPNDAEVDPLSSPAVAIIEAAINKDHFMERDIRTDADKASGRSWFKTVDFLVKKLAPSMLPGPGAVIPYESAATPVGGYSADKIVSTLRDHQDYLGRTRNLATVLADVIFGLKLVPVDFEEQLKFKNSDAARTYRELKIQGKRFTEDLERQTSEFEKKKIQANIDRNLEAMSKIVLESSGLGPDALPSKKAPEPTPSPKPSVSAPRKMSIQELREKYKRERAGASSP